MWSRARSGALGQLAGTALTAFSAFGHASLWHSGVLFLFWLFLLWVGWPAVAGGFAPPLRWLYAGAIFWVIG